MCHICWSQSELCHPLGLCMEVIKKKMITKYSVLKKKKMLMFADNCHSIDTPLHVFSLLIADEKKNLLLHFSLETLLGVSLLVTAV